MSLKRPTIAPLTRRRFLAAAGATALTAKSHALSGAHAHDSRFAYTASPGEVRVYSTQTTPWTPIQSIPSEAPVSLAIDAHTHTLHALQAVAEHQGLPRGYIESFRIDSRTGRLTQLHRQPLSLSAIYPRQMALAPDRKTLAVAVHDGSAYNLLPILEDGRPGCPIAIRKETGLNSSSPARPTQIAFNATSDRIFALDHGTAALSVFAAEPELPVLSRFPLSSGSILAHFALDPDRRLLYLSDPTDGSVLVFQHVSSNSGISLLASLQGNFTGPLAFHTSAGVLFAATRHGLTALASDPVTGALTTRAAIVHRNDQPEIHQLYISPDGNDLLALTASGVIRYEINRTSIRLSPFQPVAALGHSITLL